MLKPAPETVLDALNVVKAPLLAVPEPIVPGVLYALAASIVLVTVPESPVVTIVPVVAGTAMSNVDAVLGPFRLTWPPSVA